MFLRCDHNISYTECETDSIFPSELNFIDFSTPVKCINGSYSGPTMIASFLESINFRNDSAKKMKQSDIQSLVNIAHVKDVEFESTVEDFSSSDDGYVTLENYINAIKENGKIISGIPIYCQKTDSLKRYIHKYKCIIIETYLANSFLTSNTSGIFNISSIGNGQIQVKDYTKTFIALGYDSIGIIVLNSLGTKWGSLGFARINWNVLNGNITTSDGDEKKCFIKGVAFKGCFN